jgi:hypothetical protein
MTISQARPDGALRFSEAAMGKGRTWFITHVPEDVRNEPTLRITRLPG